MHNQRPSVMEKFLGSFKKDGADHIRIGNSGETRIGRLCGLDLRRRFYIPQLGEFLSPSCFVNWIVTGDEDARHNPHYRVKNNVVGYNALAMYAKFFQLCGVRSSLTAEAHLMQLPFVSYKQHQSGVKEFDRWRDFPSLIKEMVEHVIDPERGPKVQYPFAEDLKARVAGMVADIVAATTADDDEVIEAPRKPTKPKKQKKAEEAVTGEQPVVEEVVTETVEVETQSDKAAEVETETTAG